jgi:hypothetical protein
MAKNLSIHLQAMGRHHLPYACVPILSEGFYGVSETRMDFARLRFSDYSLPRRGLLPPE